MYNFVQCVYFGVHKIIYKYKFYNYIIYKFCIILYNVYILGV